MRRKSKNRFFAYHPQTEIRLGPRALRMTAAGLKWTSRDRMLAVRRGAGTWCCAGIERVQLLAGLEADGLAGRYADFGAGAGVAADAGFAGADAEDAKSAQFDALAGGQGL